MSTPSLQPLSQDVRSYVSACEHWLATTSTAASLPFAQDELRLLNYYADEMSTMVWRLGQLQRLNLNCRLGDTHDDREETLHSSPAL